MKRPRISAVPDGSRAVVEAMTRVMHNPSALIIMNSAAQSLLRLMSNIVLARLLAPTAFAMTSIAMLILTGVQMLSDIGIAIMVLRHGEMDEEREARLWTMQLVRGIGVSVFIFLIAQPVAWAYQDEQLGNVVRVLSVMPALQGAQSLYPILALQHRNLKPSFYMEVGGRFIGAVAAIAIAVVSPTVWAIVGGTLVQCVFAVLVSHVLGGKHPRFAFDLAFIRREWSVARWIQLSSTLSFAGMQIDKVLFPFLFGLPALGLYSIGATFALIPAQITQKWSASIFYPLTIAMLNRGIAERAQLLRLRFTMLLYSGVGVLAMMMIAPCFFMLLYKPTYYGAARFAQLLAAGVFFEVAESSLRHMPLVEGVYRFEVLPVIIRLATFLIMVAVVHATGGGAESYALSYVVAMAVSYFFMLAVDTRRGYLRPYADLYLGGGVLIAELLAYALPLPEPSRVTALAGGIGLAVITGAVLLAVHARYGLPSLSAGAKRQSGSRGQLQEPGDALIPNPGVDQ